MLVTLAAKVVAGQQAVCFLIDPSAMGAITDKAEIIDMYSRVPQQTKIVNLKEPVRLQVFLDFPDGGNVKSYVMTDTLDVPFSLISSRIKSHQTSINKHFGFLQVKPTLRVLKASETHCRFEVTVPTDSSVLCNHEWFFRMLGFENQYVLKKPDGSTFYGFVNKSEDPLVILSQDPKSNNGTLQMSLERIPEYKKLSNQERALIPKNIALEFANSDRMHDVDFILGDGSFEAYAANFMQALSKVVYGVMNLRNKSIRMQTADKEVIILSREKSPNEELQFMLVLKVTKQPDFPFLALDNALDSRADSEIKTLPWQKLISSDTGSSIEHYFPLAVLTQDSSHVPSSFFTGYGTAYCLAIVSAKGKIRSQKFSFASQLQRSLTLYFLHEDSKPVTFPCDMTIHIVLRLF